MIERDVLPFILSLTFCTGNGAIDCWLKCMLATDVWLVILFLTHFLNSPFLRAAFIRSKWKYTLGANDVRFVFTFAQMSTWGHTIFACWCSYLFIEYSMCSTDENWSDQIVRSQAKKKNRWVMGIERKCQPKIDDILSSVPFAAFPELRLWS